MTNSRFLEKVSKIAFLLVLTASVVMLFMGQWKASLGIWVGALWMFLNCFFLLRIFELALCPEPRPKNRIFLTCLVKFPVLYLVGFFILTTRFFPVWSLLTGLSVYLLVFTIMWFRMNLSSKVIEGKAV